MSDRVDPKYKSMFNEAESAVRYAQKNQWPLAKKALDNSQSIMFDHKIPKEIINLGYADEIEYIKLNPTSAEFNQTIKRTQFDGPMIKLIKEFEAANNLDVKANVVTKMNKLKNEFSEKYGGYLDEVSIKVDKTGKPIFTSLASPVTKQTDFVSSLGKSLTQSGDINKTQLQKLQNLVSKGGSKGKAAAKALQIIAAGGLGFSMEDILKGTGLIDKEYEQTASVGDAPIVEKGLSTGEKIAAGTATAGALGTKTGRKALGKILNLGFGPTGILGINAYLGVDPTESLDRAMLGVEASLLPQAVKGVTDVSSKIKNPLLRKGIETLAGVRIPGLINPTNVLRAARFTQPLGVATLVGEGLYQLGKKGYDQYQLMKDMTEQEKSDFLADQYESLGGVFGEGA